MKYDIVSVGAGHNNLVAAAYLAVAGKKLLILDKNPVAGGGVVTDGTSTPGFLHDMHSSLHINIQANPLILDDELGLQREYGLKYLYPDVVFSSIDDRGVALVSYADIDRTCASIATISERDAKAYRAFSTYASSVLSMFVSGLFVPPVPTGTFMALLDQSPEGRDLIDIMQKSCFDVANDWFVDDRVKLHLLKFASENLAGPEEKGTGLTLFIMSAFIHRYPIGMPQGGSDRLTAALLACLAKHGAEIRTGETVREVTLSNGRTRGVVLDSGERIDAKDAVLASIHPHLLGTMVAGLDASLIERAKRVRTAMMSSILCNYALERPPLFRTENPDASRASFIELVPSSLDAWRQEFDRIRYGQLPPPGTSIIKAGGSMAATVHTAVDPTRAPAGKATLYNVMFVPFDLKEGGPTRWDAVKEQVADDMFADIGRYTTNMGPENVIGRLVHSPLDMQRWSPSFQRGDIHGIAPYFHQFGGFRPLPELSQYAVPGAEGLYLCGPFMHPGGGVFGGGRATAIKMFEDLKLNFEKATRVYGKVA